MNVQPAATALHGFHLRFRPLQSNVGDCSVPCDAHGQVDLDGLSDDLRNRYFFARTLIGFGFAKPAIELND